MKVCILCGIEKPLHKFGVNGLGTSIEKYRDKCSACVSNYIRSSELGRIRLSCGKYGITDLQYMQMEFAQDRRCAICKHSKPLEIDHCHATGKVRGLLCHDCNIGLGMFKDNIKGLREAANYLEKDE